MSKARHRPPEGPILPGVADRLSIGEAAIACRLSAKTIRMAIKRGELAAEIIGGRDPLKSGAGLGYRIKKVDLEKWYFGAGTQGL